MDALKVELLFRGCIEEEVNAMKKKERKNKLKELEILRVGDDAIEKEAATKAFKPLSTAVFAAN
jgi:3-deoxy-D-manno-octulosonate 8-phosphate phosphatase KdsC-like HAD superfamily phosphatase